MSQKVKIRDSKYTQYGLSVMSTGETYFKFMTEDEDAPNLIFNFTNSVFLLPVILQTTPNGQTWGYSIKVNFEKLLTVSN